MLRHYLSTPGIGLHVNKKKHNPILSLNILVKSQHGTCMLSVRMEHPGHRFDNVVPARQTGDVEFERHGC